MMQIVRRTFEEFAPYALRDHVVTLFPPFFSLGFFTLESLFRVFC